MDQEASCVGNDPLVVRTEFSSLLEIGDRLRFVCFSVMEHSAPIVEVGTVRLQFDSLCNRVDRLRELVLTLELFTGGDQRLNV